MQADLDIGARNALLSKFFHLNLTSGQNRLSSYHPDQNQLEIELLERHLDFQTCLELDRDVVNLLFNASNKRFTNCFQNYKSYYFKTFLYCAISTLKVWNFRYFWAEWNFDDLVFFLFRWKYLSSGQSEHNIRCNRRNVTWTNKECRIDCLLELNFLLLSNLFSQKDNAVWTNCQAT